MIDIIKAFTVIIWVLLFLDAVAFFIPLVQKQVVDKGYNLALSTKKAIARFVVFTIVLILVFNL